MFTTLPSAFRISVLDVQIGKSEANETNNASASEIKERKEAERTFLPGNVVTAHDAQRPVAQLTSCCPAPSGPTVPAVRVPDTHKHRDSMALCVFTELSQ